MKVAIVDRLSNFRCSAKILQNICILHETLISIMTLWSREKNDIIEYDHQDAQRNYTTAKKTEVAENKNLKRFRIHKLAFIFIFAISRLLPLSCLLIWWFFNTIADARPHDPMMNFFLKIVSVFFLGYWRLWKLAKFEKWEKIKIWTFLRNQRNLKSTFNFFLLYQQFRIYVNYLLTIMVPSRVLLTVINVCLSCFILWKINFMLFCCAWGYLNKGNC